uniref:Uncharacterized protein n=1 Tax=Talaromyces marneffei PM1 TaxID=1077442 RepID=A0A093UKI5_TALMA
MTRTSTLTSSTTENQARLRVVGYPSEYEVHHSNTSPSLDNETHDEPLSTSQQPVNVNSEGPEWANHYRRIPPYRPVNRNLNQGERRVYINDAERAFITIMFLGVRNNAVFGYKIGGEW